VPQGAAVVAALAERDILVDCRPDVGLRVSPHYYNTDEELDRCLDAVLEILRTKAWEKHAQKGTAY
jgi:selenocysteine lyase/cysteine desulfurase